MPFTTPNFQLAWYSPTTASDLNVVFDLAKAVTNNFTTIDANAIPRFTTTAITMTGSYSTSGFIRASTFSSTGAILGGSFTTTGTIQGGSFTTSGTIFSGGAIQGGSFTTSGTIQGGSFTTSGAIQGGSFTTSGTVQGGSFTTSGNITGGSLNITGSATIGTISNAELNYLTNVTSDIQTQFNQRPTGYIITLYAAESTTSSGSDQIIGSSLFVWDSNFLPSSKNIYFEVTALNSNTTYNTIVTLENTSGTDVTTLTINSSSLSRSRSSSISLTNGTSYRVALRVTNPGTAGTLYSARIIITD